MATLASIGITVGGGLGIFTITLACFTAAVIKRNIFVAGRCVARPKDVIYNPNPKHPSQDRGRTPWGWMTWAMSLSYDTLLNGVPGTGTREGGLKGHLLKVNLDGIVIMRFHYMGLKLSAMGTILYLSLVMPLYATARCSFLQEDLDTPECTNDTLTDYQQLTLANVSPLKPYEDEDNWFGSLVDVIERNNMGRLYAVAVCTWLITWYAMNLLHMEWLDILAMRRVYYLEANHWKDRTEELAKTAEKHNKKDAARIEKRPVWVPHPELRDTVPNIELYSILVGGLPSLPTDAVQDVEAVFSKKQSMDWQLSVTTAFFDHCVPNQPGFSSSVAAVTILPAATQITEAWQQWYKAAAKVRKLRFIRERIKSIREKGSDTEGSDSADVEVGKNTKPAQPRLRRRVSLHHEDVLGSQTDIEVEDHLFHALNLGPEQTAVYGREFAQGAANFAPHGWFEWKINNAGLKELLVMEEDAAEDVRQANVELQEARDRIALKSMDDDESEHVSLASGDFKATSGPQHMAPSDHGGIASGRSASVRSSGNIASSRRRNSDSILQEMFAPSLSEDDAAVLSSAMRSKQSLNSSVSDEKDPPPRKSTTKDIKRLSSTNLTTENLDASSRSSKSSLQSSPTKSSTRGGRSNKKLSRASMAQLPTALGLEAGLWTEQSKLSKGSSQAIPRARKSGRRGSTGSAPPRRVMSVDIQSMRPMDNTTKNYYSDVAKMKSRNTNDTSSQRDRTIMTRNSFDDDKLTVPSSRIERASLKKAVTTGTPDVDMGNVSTLLKNILETGERGAMNEPTGDSSSESCKNSDRSIDLRSDGGEGGKRSGKTLESEHSHNSNDSIWETLEKDLERKQSLRQRLSKIKLTVETANETETTKSSKPAEAAAPTTNGKHATIVQQQVTPTPALTNDNISFESDWVADAVEDVEENLEIAYNFEQRAGLRKRENAVSFSQNGKCTEKWGKVMTIVEETAKDMNGANARKRVISNGRWTLPSFRQICGGMNDRMSGCMNSFTFKSPELLDDFARDSTYAVVTFTSRQAAVAARHCLADSRGADRWVNLTDLPTPPLADAPVCSTSCRGCVRPVTLSISDTQKKIRHFVALICLAIVYFFYTIPLTAVQNTVSEERLTELYPEISEAKQSNPIMANIFLGLIPALIWILFFAICPPLFKIIANFGSNGTSAVGSENSALRYFWGFMVLAAFTGDSFQRAVINGFRDGIRIGSELQTLVEETAERIPIKVSSNWLNWIIARMFVVLPTQYLLQTNTFLFTWLGWNCCQRAVRGGGAGPPIPYRIYVDSGVVLLCLFALAPSSPLIAPAACLYFLICLPLLRWTMIFLYKPKFDVGGGRFPFIFDVCVSAMLVGQILLMTMMLLKQATGPALAAIMPFLPTLLYRFRLRSKYLRAFSDAALLQTSLLDGWDNEDDATDEEREEFRKFLVDCHKAAYVPVCIASGDARTLITAEPAVVIPMDDDHVEEEAIGNNLSEDSADTMHPTPPAASTRNLRTYKAVTVGARAPITPRTPRIVLASPAARKRKSIEEGTVPSIPNLPIQPGVMMRRSSHTLRNSLMVPESPGGSHASPTPMRETLPSSPVVGRRASVGSSGRQSGGSSRRASLGSMENGRKIILASPGSRRASFAATHSVQSPRSGSSMVLLSPTLQQAQSQPGRMMRRMSRSGRVSISHASLQATSEHASLPATPELPFG